jgi:hypothetical protein
VTPRIVNLEKGTSHRARHVFLDWGPADPVATVTLQSATCHIFSTVSVKVAALSVSVLAETRYGHEQVELVHDVLPDSERTVSVPRVYPDLGLAT